MTFSNMLGTACLAASICLTHGALAQQFRIETQIYSGKNKKAMSEHLTLFVDNLIYDFRTGPEEEIVILDQERESFVLLKVNSKKKLSINVEQVLEYVAAMKVSSAFQKLDARLLEPNFKVRFNPESSELELDNGLMRYQCKCKTYTSPGLLRSYRNFVDCYARLNSIGPGQLPPFSRLSLNQSLAEHQLIPESVSLESDRFKIKMRSDHQLAHQLTQRDRERIDQAGKYWVEFTEVSIGDFFMKEEVPTSVNEKSK